MKYSLSHYLYDSFRLAQVNEQIQKLTGEYASCRWAAFELDKAMEQKHEIIGRMRRYEALPQNRAANGDE